MNLDAMASQTFMHTLPKEYALLGALILPFVLALSSTAASASQRGAARVGPILKRLVDAVLAQLHRKEEKTSFLYRVTVRDFRIKSAGAHKIHGAGCIAENGRRVWNVDMSDALSWFVHEHNLVRHTKEARYNRYTDAQMAFDLAEKSNMGFVELLPGWRVRVCKERDLWLSYSESNEEVKKDSEIVMRKTCTLWELNSNRTDVPGLQLFLRQTMELFNKACQRAREAVHDDGRYFHVYASGNRRGIPADEDGERLPIFDRYPLCSARRFEDLHFPQREGMQRLVEAFCAQRDAEVPERLNVLLYGPPGCGKTSFAKCLANATGRQVVSVPLRDLGSDEELMRFFNGIRYRYKCMKTGKVQKAHMDMRDFIFIVEEIDVVLPGVLKPRKRDGANSNVSVEELEARAKGASEEKGSEDEDEEEDDVLDLSRFTAFAGKKTKGDGAAKAAGSASLSEDKITLKGFLEVLDGVYDAPNRCVVITTNHPEKLDRAFTRPGRFDIRIHMTYMKAEQARAMVLAHYDEMDEETLRRVGELRLTPARLEELIRLCPAAAELRDAVARIAAQSTEES